MCNLFRIVCIAAAACWAMMACPGAAHAAIFTLINDSGQSLDYNEKGSVNTCFCYSQPDGPPVFTYPWEQMPIIPPGGSITWHAENEFIGGDTDWFVEWGVLTSEYPPVTIFSQ
jgi:hypothetical protein